jgi:hypothetical protein
VKLLNRFNELKIILLVTTLISALNLLIILRPLLDKMDDIKSISSTVEDHQGHFLN